MHRLDYDGSRLADDYCQSLTIHSHSAGITMTMRRLVVAKQEDAATNVVLRALYGLGDCLE